MSGNQTPTSTAAQPKEALNGLYTRKVQESCSAIAQFRVQAIYSGLEVCLYLSSPLSLHCFPAHPFSPPPEFSSISLASVWGSFSIRQIIASGNSRFTLSEVNGVEKYFLFPKSLFGHSVMSNFLRSHGQQHARLPCPSLSPWVCPNSGASLVALVVKNQPVNAGDVRDTVSIPGSGRSPGEGNDNPLQYSCLENYG